MEGLVWLHNNLHSSSFLVGVAKAFSFIGDAGIIWIIFAAILLCFKKTRRGGIVMLISLAVGHILNEYVFKMIFTRTRPFDAYPELRQFLESINVEPPSSFSFPSGHSFSAFNCAVILMLYNKKMGFLTLPIATGIALSRIFLCVHYPTDVLAGAILGVLMAVLVYWLDKLIMKKIAANRRAKVRAVHDKDM